MDNDSYIPPCSAQVCEKKFHLTKSFSSLEEVEKQLTQCQCCEKIDTIDIIAQRTYQKISVLWAERHNLQVGKV